MAKSFDSVKNAAPGQPYFLKILSIYILYQYKDEICDDLFQETGMGHAQSFFILQKKFHKTIHISSLQFGCIMKQSFEESVSCKRTHWFCKIKRLELELKDICCLKTNDNPKKTTDNVRRLARIFHFERLLMTDNFGNFLSCIHLFSFMYILPTFIHAKFV